jgi:hypothetical protein
MRVLVGSASESDLLGSALGHMEDARRMMRMRRLFVVRFQMLMDDGMCDSPRGLGERGQQQRECHSASGQSDHRRTRYPQPRYAHLSIGGLRLNMQKTAIYGLGLAPEVRHSRAHRHARPVHGHPHWPDLHHRHDHVHDPRTSRFKINTIEASAALA